MSSGWARLGIAVGGAILGGWALGPIGYSLGFMAGNYIGSQIFHSEYKSKMPAVHDYPVQNSAAGIPIPIVLGTDRLAGNVIWMGPLTAYQIKHTSGGGGKGGGDETASYETKYRRSFLIAICEGPASIRAAWKGKVSISINSFTIYDGDGNSGISTLIGEDYAEYSNVLCAYFEDYELGNSQALPNFIFEVVSNTPQVARVVCGGDSTGASTSDYVSFLYEEDGDLFANLQTYHGVAGQTDEVSRASATDSNGNIYCAYDNESPTRGEIWRFDADGNLDTDWGTSGKILLPSNSLWATCVTDSSDNLYVGFQMPSGEPVVDTLRKYNSSGTLLWSAQPSNATAYAGIFQKIIIRNGVGYCIDRDNGRAPVYIIAKFDLSDGSYLNTYSSIGSSVGDFDVDAHDFIYRFGGLYLYRVNDSDTVTDQVQVIYGGAYAGSMVSVAVISGASASDTKVIIGGEQTDSFPYTEAYFHLLKYDYDFSNIEASKLLIDSTTGRSVEYLFHKDADDDVVYAIFGGSTSLNRIYEIDVSDLSETLIVYKTPYNNFMHCCAQMLAPTAVQDMNFAEMVKFLLTDERCGGYSESDLITADFDDVIDYCNDNNLKGSLTLKEQKPLPDWIAYVCSHFQGYFYEIGGKIGLNCYRVQDSVMSITQSDFVTDSKEEPPVQIKKRDYTETINRLEATWTDRSNNYKTAVVPAFDRIDQRESGQMRTKTLDLKMIMTKELASKMTWRLFIDQIYRFSTYTFKLGYKSMLLDVGDVIDVTDGNTLVAKKMRVMTKTEQQNGRVSVISAIEDISDIYPDISYEIQESEVTPDEEITLEDGSIAFREAWNDNKLYLSITPGTTQCNGFYVYMSYDDVTYALAGKAPIGGVTGGEANSSGTLQSSLPAYTSVIHRGADSFNVSIGTITDLDTAITDDDFFNNRKLAKIGDEIIAYKTCVESATEGIWTISNIIRGLFGTAPVAHNSGEAFDTLDIDLTYNLVEADIGKTLYFKVVSYYSGQIQLVSEVSSQSYQVKGTWKKPAASSLLRLSSDENDGGQLTYTGTSFTLYWNLPCQKGTGFNQGGFDLNDSYPDWRYGDSESELVGGNGVQYGNQIADDELQGIDLVFETTAGVLISQRSVAATATSATIDKTTDLGGNSTAVIKVYPRRSYRTDRAESITVTGV